MKEMDKRVIDKGFHTGYEVDYITIQKSDYEYLKEQAERVQELEEDCNYISHQYGLEVEQNKRYREALEFYADRDNYKPDRYDPNIHDYMSAIDYDEGATARKTLEVRK